jgi:hypothetical protein
MATSCGDFDRGWNDLLDRRGAPAPGAEAALAAHAAACPSCRDRAAGFEALRLALADRALAPAAPADPALTARILDAWRAEVAAPAGRPFRPTLAPLARAAAAALVLALGLGLLLRGGRIAPPAPAGPPPLAGAAPARPLAETLADATAATLDLARETSAPAARLGRLVLASAGPGPVAAAGPDLPVALPASVVPSAEVMESVGAGLRPLSGSARHAFGFLLGPAAVPPSPAPAPPDA